MSKYQYQSIPSGSEELGEEIQFEENAHSTFNVAAVGFIVAVTMFLYIFLPRYKPDVVMMNASLVKNVPFKQISHPEPPSAFWGSIGKPFPTGAFWTNLVIRNGDFPVAVLPYAVKCLDSGIQISYGAWRRAVTQLYIQDVFGNDIQISSYQPYLGRGVESYDNLSVTMAYRTSSGKYKVHLVKGSPYITVVFDNVSPVISTGSNKILNAEFRPFRSASGVQYVLTLSNNQKWLVYCSETVPLNVKDNTLTSPYPIRGFVRVAILPLQNTDGAFVNLMTYVQRYPTGASFTMSYPPGNIAVITYQFNTVGTGSLLMLSLPHHNQVMMSPPDNDESRRVQAALSPFYCMKGKMRAVIGDIWKLQYTLPQVYSVSSQLILTRFRLDGTTFLITSSALLNSMISLEISNAMSRSTFPTLRTLTVSERRSPVLLASLLSQMSLAFLMLVHQP